LACCSAPVEENVEYGGIIVEYLSAEAGGVGGVVESASPVEVNSKVRLSFVQSDNLK
jgi:hypothetical protein